MDNAKLAINRDSLKLPDLALGQEWALLELLTLGLYSANERELFAELIQAENLDWQELLAQATRHKIITFLAFHTTGDHYYEVIPSDVKQQLEIVLFFNRHKINIYRREAARISRAFTSNNIQFVGTKGISFESTIYQGNGSRAMSDIDFMIAPQYRKLASKILSELGYGMGAFDSKTKKISPHSRETLIGYRLNSDHLPAHVLLIDDVIAPFVEVDIANSLTWTVCPFQVPVEIALENIICQSIPGFEDIQLPCFSPQFQFIFTILHLYREAWRILSLKKDVNLCKFGDILRLWKVYSDVLQTEELINLIKELGIVKPVLWVLEHLDRTFHTDIVSSLGLDDRVTEKWLASVGSSNGKVRQWQGTMRERLFCKDRRQLFRVYE